VSIVELIFLFVLIVWSPLGVLALHGCPSYPLLYLPFKSVKTQVDPVVTCLHEKGLTRSWKKSYQKRLGLNLVLIKIVQVYYFLFNREGYKRSTVSWNFFIDATIYTEYKCGSCLALSVIENKNLFIYFYYSRIWFEIKWFPPLNNQMLCNVIPILNNYMLWIKINPVLSSQDYFTIGGLTVLYQTTPRSLKGLLLPRFSLKNTTVDAAGS